MEGRGTGSAPEAAIPVRPRKAAVPVWLRAAAVSVWPGGRATAMATGSATGRVRWALGRAAGRM